VAAFNQHDIGYIENDIRPSARTGAAVVSAIDVSDRRADMRFASFCAGFLSSKLTSENYSALSNFPKIGKQQGSSTFAHYRRALPALWRS